MGKKSSLKGFLYIFIPIVVSAYGIFFLMSKTAPEDLVYDSKTAIGAEVDSLDGVIVHYNGVLSNTSGTKETEDGYYLGIEYQSTEFVRRYYYEHYNHKMPNSYGTAIEFFNTDLSDGELNEDRGLLQFSNSSDSKPQKGDILIWSKVGSYTNGHAAIVYNVSNDEIEFIQQNGSPIDRTRDNFKLLQKDGKWYVDSENILGWMRMNE